MLLNDTNCSTAAQISESLKRFGLSEGVGSMLAARFDGNPEEVRVGGSR